MLQLESEKLIICNHQYQSLIVFVLLHNILKGALNLKFLNLTIIRETFWL